MSKYVFTISNHFVTLANQIVNLKKILAPNVLYFKTWVWSKPDFVTSSPLFHLKPHDSRDSTAGSIWNTLSNELLLASRSLCLRTSRFLTGPRTSNCSTKSGSPELQNIRQYLSETQQPWRGAAQDVPSPLNATFGRN